MPNTTLWLCRHGAPNWMEGGKTNNDPGLLPAGRQQAEALRDHLAKLSPGFGRMITTRSKRAIETADIITDRQPIMERYGGLSEWKQPRSWDYQENLTQVHADLEEFHNRDRQDLWRGIHGGEDMEEYILRIVNTFEDIMEDIGINRTEFGYLRKNYSDNKPILMVLHQGVIGVIRAHLMNNEVFPRDIWSNHHIAFGSISRFVLEPGHRHWIWRQLTWNETGHLGIDADQGVTKNGQTVGQ